VCYPDKKYFSFLAIRSRGHDVFSCGIPRCASDSQAQRLTETKYFKSSRCLVPVDRDKLPIAFCREFATSEYLDSLRPLDGDKLVIFCISTENSSRNNGLRCTAVNAPGIRRTTKTNFSVVIKTPFALVSRLCTTDYEITFILQILYKRNKWAFSQIEYIKK